jgi:subtilisin-like proprotein convertase family protein
VPAGKWAGVTMTPTGTTYLAGAQNGDGSCSAGTSFNALIINDLGVDLRGTDGATVLATANSGGAGVAETIAPTSLGGAGTYFVRVFAGGVNNVQGYQLAVTISDQPVNATINDVAMAEGNSGTTNANFTVSLSAASASTLTLNYATANGTAIGGATSTQSNTGAITIPTSGTNSTPYPSNIVVAGAPGTITKATVTLNSYSHTYSRDTDVLLVGPGGQKIVLMSDAGGQVPASNVNLTLDATATSSLPASTLSSGTFLPTNIADGEGNDTWGAPAPVAPYSGTLTDLIGASPNGTWSLYITDDFNGDGGSLAGGWTLTLETTGGDFAPTSGTLTFTPGQTSKTITVPLNGDTTVEANETFTVNLSNPSPGLVITDATGAGTITDDDGVPLPNLSINDVSLTEGNSGTSNMTFTVSLSAISASTVTVSAVTSAGTATAGTDYTTTGPSTITFSPGQTSKTFLVPIVGDALDEANETFTVTLSSPSGANISDNQGTGTITDDDAAPSVSVAFAILTEGDTGTSNMSFVVSLSAASGQTVTVSAVTSAGTATAGTDYTTTGPSTITFNPGDISKAFVVPIVGDTIDESNETFTVTLSSPTNATLGTATATGTITDNDGAPTVSIGNATLTEGDAGTSNMSFTVSLSSASAQTVTVSAVTSAGTATATTDYTTTGPSTITFVPGDTSETFLVPIVGDTLDEANETFTVTLSSPTNATLGTATGTGTITDNDAAPTLSINDVTVTEGTGATVNAQFTVALSAISGQTVTVSAATASGTAISGTDFTAAGPHHAHLQPRRHHSDLQRHGHRRLARRSLGVFRGEPEFGERRHHLRHSGNRDHHRQR